MCGRYTLRRIDLIRAALGAVPAPPFDEFTERPRFNVAPSQLIPLVRIDSQGRRVLDLARWGFIPAWAKSLPRLKPINARAENLARGAMFRSALGRRRCLIPADGFYEWKAHPGQRAKQPYFIRFKDDRPFAFAGLFERWTAPDADQPLQTCAIITTAPNELLKPLHDRMPAIVRPEDYARWLDPETPAETACEILQPHRPDEMEAYPVDARVNRATEDGAGLVERKSDETLGFNDEIRMHLR
jgi:putative SOS response-associated peptidase YedK